MEDDKLKDIFNDFRPTLSSDARFMATLKRNMEKVEMVKQQHEALQRRNRIAVIVAALAGLVSGVLLTLIYPTLSRMLSSFSIDMPGFAGATLSWLLIGGVCLAITINAYDLALSRLPLKRPATP